MSILYLHGFASAVKRISKKYDELGKIDKVVAFAPDYSEGFASVLSSTFAFVREQGNIKGVVGTSMGGYLASHIAAQLKVPCVAINPSIQPSESLKKYVGKHHNHDGSVYELNVAQVSTYPDFNTAANSLIIVSNNDAVIPPQLTQAFAQEKHIPIISCDYGDHRFEDISSLMTPITEHLQPAQ